MNGIFPQKKHPLWGPPWPWKPPYKRNISWPYIVTAWDLLIYWDGEFWYIKKPAVGTGKHSPIIPMRFRSNGVMCGQMHVWSCMCITIDVINVYVYIYIYPLVNYNRTMENHHFQRVNPLYMAMFNSYVSLPEGKGHFLGEHVQHCTTSPTWNMSEPIPGGPQGAKIWTILPLPYRIALVDIASLSVSVTSWNPQ